MLGRTGRSLQGRALLLEGKRRRAFGDYTRKTLGIYARAWDIAQTPEALLQFCLFRHELGYPLADSLQRLLTDTATSLNAKDREIARLLLCPERRAAQNGLRAEFASWLGSIVDKRIAVVGNSARLISEGKAADIEECGCVVRFNHWQAPMTDVGRKTDLWIRSPLDIQASVSPVPNPPPRWVAVSGPEMSSRRLEWNDWERANGGRLLSIPISVWHHLVRVIGAPPSAGLLTLAWLKSISGSWHGIEAFGFGYSGGRYHASTKQHRPSRRHDWGKESEILERWKSDGLVIR